MTSSYSDLARGADWGLELRGSDSSVFRLQSAETLGEPEFLAFMRRACDFPWTPDVAGVVSWMKSCLGDERTVLLIHRGESGYDGLVFIHAGTSIWDYSPTILYTFYDELSSESRHEMAAAVAQWMDQRGYRSIMAQTIGDTPVERIIAAGEGGGVGDGEVVGSVIRFLRRK